MSNIVKNTIRGSGCSKSGNNYEKLIYDIVTKCVLNNTIIFNTQKIGELGGSNHRNDIECNFEKEKDIPIEIKKMGSPDWMQCCLIYDTNRNSWIGSSKNKIPEKSKMIFENIVKNTVLFNGKIPPFMTKNITHIEWINTKKESNDFEDMYIDCPNDTILKLYSEKGCKYIQISEKGLYHLGYDICNFGVPEFICPQELRIRTKIHTTCNTKGFCKLSVTVACKPKDIKKLDNSNVSLDDIQKLPANLTYNN
jgi:hypothetical protein